MPVYYIVDLAYQFHFYFASDNQLAILCKQMVGLCVPKSSRKGAEGWTLLGSTPQTHVKSAVLLPAGFI